MSTDNKHSEIPLNSTPWKTDKIQFSGAPDLERFHWSFVADLHLLPCHLLQHILCLYISVSSQ